MPKRTNEFEILFLGTASGLPVAGRHSSALYFTSGGKAYLLDCGDGVTGAILKHKLPYLDLDAVIITHTHPDHCAGLPLLLQLLHVNKRTRPLTVYLPEEAVETTSRYLWSCYLFPEFMSYPYKLQKINPSTLLGASGQTNWREQGFQIIPHANTHLRYYRDVIVDNSYSNMMEAYSLEIHVGDKRLVYSSDVGTLEDLEEFAPGADLLIVEGLHVKPEELFSKLKDWQVDKTVMTHFAPGLEKREKVMIALAKKSGIKGFRLAVDGMRVR